MGRRYRNLLRGLLVSANHLRQLLFFEAWRSKSFMLSMMGMKGKRCTGLLSDAEWYKRDKTSGAFYALP